MKRTYVFAALVVLVAVAVASPALGGPSLKSLVKKEVKKQLKGKTGPPGPQGAPGATGAPGGPIGGGLMTGRIIGMGNSFPEFASPSGRTNATSHVNAITLAANAPMTARNLTVLLVTTPLTGSQSRTFQLTVSGIAQPGMTCTITAPPTGNGTSCTSSGTDTIPGGPNSTISIEETPANNPPSGPTEDAVFGWQATTP